MKKELRRPGERPPLLFFPDGVDEAGEGFHLPGGEALGVEGVLLGGEHQGVYGEVQKLHHLEQQGDGGVAPAAFDVRQVDEGDVQHLRQLLLGVALFGPGLLDGCPE